MVSHQLLVYRRELGTLASSLPKLAILMFSFTYAYHRIILSTERLAFLTISKPIELRGEEIRTVVNAESPGRIIANSPKKRVIFDMLIMHSVGTREIKSNALPGAHSKPTRRKF